MVIDLTMSSDDDEEKSSPTPRRGNVLSEYEGGEKKPDPTPRWGSALSDDDDDEPCCPPNPGLDTGFAELQGQLASTLGRHGFGLVHVQLANASKGKFDDGVRQGEALKIRRYPPHTRRVGVGPQSTHFSCDHQGCYLNWDYTKWRLENVSDNYLWLRGSLNKRSTRKGQTRYVFLPKPSTVENFRKNLPGFLTSNMGSILKHLTLFDIDHCFECTAEIDLRDYYNCRRCRQRWCAVCKDNILEFCTTGARKSMGSFTHCSEHLTV